MDDRVLEQLRQLRIDRGEDNPRFSLDDFAEVVIGCETILIGVYENSMQWRQSAQGEWVGNHHYALATELSIAQFTDEDIKPGMRYKIGDLHLQVIEYYEEIDAWCIARVEE